ncbi:MAG: transcriptional repressor [Chloroflexi bacterium]|nr:transcriptional repressor [Chloroflexota bacterium]
MQQHCNKGDARFVRQALKALRAAGYRITRPRRLVLAALGQGNGPMSPYDLQKALDESGEKLDHVTIYRTVELLQRLNLAHKVLSVGGYARCTLNNEEGCHGYLVCRGCGKLQEFADASLCRREDELAERMGFRAERHLTEFSGLCSVCQV